MKVSDGTWDVRCPENAWKALSHRAGYYFRVDHATAQRVLNILSAGISHPGARSWQDSQSGTGACPV